VKRAIALFQPDVSLLVLRHPAHNHASLFRGQPPEKAPGEEEKVIYLKGQKGVHSARNGKCLRGS